MTIPYFTNPSNEDTSNGIRPQNIDNGISQQPLVGSYSTLNLSLDHQTIFYKSIKWRWFSKDDDSKY